MHASVGDVVRVQSRSTGTPEVHGEVIEVRGPDGSPPYVIRFDDGHEGLVYPGPDTIIEHPAQHA